MTPTRSTSRRQTRRGRLLLAPVACALVLGATACGGSSEASSAGTSSAMSGMSSSAMGSSSAGGGMTATATTLMIENFAYKTPASVSPGAKLEVMNMDGEAHTVTADKGDAFDVKSPPGEKVSFTAPTKPGSYPFHCTYHSNMHGVLVVK